MIIFELLLNQTSFWETHGTVAKIDLSLKQNHHKPNWTKLSLFHSLTYSVVKLVLIPDKHGYVSFLTISMNVPRNSARISLPASERIFGNFILLDLSVSGMSNSKIIERKNQMSNWKWHNVKNQNIEIKDYFSALWHYRKQFELKNGLNSRLRLSNLSTFAL